jgi:hypothetical protein
MTDPTPRTLVHYRWDLDKTYLRTEFDTTRDLIHTFLQRADQKDVVPGAPTLLRELLRSSPNDPCDRRVTFISGSPRQMRRVLTRKLRLDGIEPDAFLLKPNLSNLLRFRFRAIRSQTAYKLGALLTSRVPGPHVEELLFGDDAEQDAFIYNLYRDVVRGQLPIAHFDWILRRAHTEASDRRELVDAMERCGTDPTLRVRRIFIHLARRSPTRRFDVFGRSTVPVFNWFQAALVLRADGLLPRNGLLSMTTALGQQGYTVDRLTNSTHDLFRRGFIEASDIRALQRELRGADLASGDAPPGVLAHALAARLDAPLPSARTSVPDVARIDYTVAVRDLARYRPPRLDLAEWLGR